MSTGGKDGKPISHSVSTRNSQINSNHLFMGLIIFVHLFLRTVVHYRLFTRTL